MDVVWCCYLFVNKYLFPLEKKNYYYYYELVKFVFKNLLLLLFDGKSFAHKGGRQKLMLDCLVGFQIILG